MASTQRKAREGPGDTAQRIQSTVHNIRSALQEPDRVETSKRKNFRRISEPRLANVLEAMDILAQMADRSRYDYTDADIDYIERLLTNHVAETIEKFVRGTPRPHVRLPDLPSK